MEIGDKIYVVQYRNTAEPIIYSVLNVAKVSKSHVYVNVDGGMKFKKPTPDGELIPVPHEQQHPFVQYKYYIHSEYPQKIAASMKEKKERKALIDQILAKAQTLPIEELRKLAN